MGLFSQKYKYVFGLFFKQKASHDAHERNTVHNWASATKSKNKVAVVFCIRLNVYHNPKLCEFTSKQDDRQHQIFDVNINAFGTVVDFILCSPGI